MKGKADVVGISPTTALDTDQLSQRREVPRRLNRSPKLLIKSSWLHYLSGRVHSCCEPLHPIANIFLLFLKYYFWEIFYSGGYFRKITLISDLRGYLSLVGRCVCGVNLSVCRICFLNLFFLGVKILKCILHTFRLLNNCYFSY